MVIAVLETLALKPTDLVSGCSCDNDWKDWGKRQASTHVGAIRIAAVRTKWHAASAAGGLANGAAAALSSDEGSASHERVRPGRSEGGQEGENDGSVFCDHGDDDSRAAGRLLGRAGQGQQKRM